MTGNDEPTEVELTEYQKNVLIAAEQINDLINAKQMSPHVSCTALMFVLFGLVRAHYAADDRHAKEMIKERFDTLGITTSETTAFN
jgi:hypothetical protein